MLGNFIGRIIMVIARVGRSLLGACYRSELGVLEDRKTFPEFVMIFQDEASEYNHPTGFVQWQSDYQTLLTAIALHGEPQNGIALLDIADDGSDPDHSGGDASSVSNIKPHGVPWRVRPFDVDRPPSTERIIEIYEEARTGTPKMVSLLIDETASMGRSVIASELEAFEGWLDGQGIAWQEVSMASEEWLFEIALHIYIQALT